MGSGASAVSAAVAFLSPEAPAEAVSELPEVAKAKLRNAIESEVQDPATDKVAAEKDTLTLSASLASGSGVFSNLSVQKKDLVSVLLDRVRESLGITQSYLLLPPGSSAKPLYLESRIGECGLTDGDSVTVVIHRRFDPKEVTVQKSTCGEWDCDDDGADVIYPLLLRYGITVLKKFGENDDVKLSIDRETAIETFCHGTQYEGKKRYDVVEMASKENFNTWACKHHGTCRAADIEKACHMCQTVVERGRNVPI